MHHNGRMPQHSSGIAKLVLTVPEAAEIAGHGTTWIYDRIQAGESFGGAVMRQEGRRIEIYRVPFLAWVKEYRSAEPEYISVTEAARLLGHRYSVIYERLRNGETYGGAVIHDPSRTTRRIRIDLAKLRAHFGDHESATAQAS
jgi:hypothetical protein